MSKIDPAATIYRLGEDLWYAVATAYPRSAWAEKMRTTMESPRPGDQVIVSYTLRREAGDIVGTLIARTDEPYPDWDEELNGEPSPTRPVWEIETLDGRRIRWENVTVRRLPTETIL